MCDTCGCTTDVERMSGAEQVKARSNRLRGTLAAELLEDTAVFSDDAGRDSQVSRRVSAG